MSTARAVGPQAAQLVPPSTARAAGPAPTPVLPAPAAKFEHQSRLYGIECARKR